MKVESEELQRLKSRVALTFKCSPKTPTDFELLSDDVYKRTGRTISVTTLKRVWGYVSAGHGTSYSTLSLLCRYVGFADWDSFIQHTKDETAADTSGFGQEDIIACSILEPDTELLLKWLPDKSCVIRKIGHPDLFKIVEAHNIKLLAGDSGNINSLRIGQPLFITNCRRNSISIGDYHGASDSGVQSITIIEM